MNEVKLKDLPIRELPRERFIRYGSEVLTNEEILTLLIRCGYKNVNAKTLSLRILKEINGIENLKNISLSTLTNIKGIGISKAISILSALELGKRVYMNNYSEETKLNNVDLIYKTFKELFYNQKQELFYVVYLDTKKNLINYELLFKGTIDSSIVHPREIFKGAVKESAASIVLMHNHPSGDVTPSINDIEFTDNIMRLSKMMGIKLIDHIIFGKNNKFSFFENNMLR